MAKDIKSAQESIMAALEANGGEFMIPEGEPPIDVPPEEDVPLVEEPLPEEVPPPEEEPPIEVLSVEPDIEPQPDPQLSILEQIRDGIMAQNQPQQPFQPPEPPIPEEPQDPLMGIDPDAFVERLAENPSEVLANLIGAVKENTAREVKQELLQELAPALSFVDNKMGEQEVAGVFKEFFEGNDDATNTDRQKYVNEIGSYLRENQLPLSDPRSLKEAYLTAKNADLGDRKSFEEYLGDDASIDKMLSDEGFTERLLGNPALLEKAKSHEGIKGGIIDGYLADLASGGTPRVLSDAGGLPPATPPIAKPRTINAAKEKYLRDLEKK